MSPLPFPGPRFQDRKLANGQVIMIDTHWICRVEDDPPLETTQDYVITEQI